MRHAGVFLREGHELTLLQGSQAFFPSLCAAVDGATQSVWLETYIFDLHGSGAQVARALLRAARRGVEVRLVVDGVGTGPLPRDWARALDEAGVQVAVFSPLGPLGLLIPSRWRRLHRKLCLVDGEILFCGGINILDDFHDHYHGPLVEPRFDLAVRVRGPLVADARQTMALQWLRIRARQDLRQLPWALEGWLQPPAVGALPLAHRGAAGAHAALVLRDNLRHRTRIEKAYLRAIGGARHEIIIANAYFLPGRRLRKALVLAAQRGVRVQLLVQGKYEGFMQYHAARPVMGALLAAGVHIHEYAPSFLHAKVAVVDGHWCTVGSSNLDPLSLLLAREANVVIEDPHFSAVLRDTLCRAMDREGVPMDPARYQRRPWRERVLDRLAFGLMRLALFLTGKRY